MMDLDTYDYRAIREEIRDEVRGLGEKFRKFELESTRVAIDAGFTLCALKERLPHGQFGSYRDQALHVPERRAQLQMRLPGLCAKMGRDRLERLPVTVAYKVAAPGVDEQVICEIIADFERGDTLTVEIVVTRIDEAKKSTRQPSKSADPKDVEDVGTMLIKALGPIEVARLVGFLSDARVKEVRALSAHLGASLTTPKRQTVVSLPAVFG